VGSPAAEGEHREVELDHRDPPRPERRVELARSRGGDDAAVAERDAVHAEGERLLRAHLDQVEALVSQPLDGPRGEDLRADGRQLLGEDSDQDVDVDVALREGLHPRFPAVLLEPGGDLARRDLLGAGLAAADQHAARLDDHHVPSLQGARRDHGSDRDPGLLVEADRRRVLAAPPPLA
jgi:hypothetical protein